MKPIHVSLSTPGIIRKHAGCIVESESPLTVQSSPDQWHYAVSVALGDAIAASQPLVFPAKVSASVNYQINLPTAPSSVGNYTVDEWDSGLWDVAQWDAGTTQTVATKWQSIGKAGFSVSPQIQITCGVTPFPRTELITYDIIYERGGVFV